MCSTEDTYSLKQVDLFDTPSRVIIGGGSGVGKTTLLLSLLKTYYNRFDKIIICGGDEGVYKDLSEDITKRITYSPTLLDPFDEILYEGYRVWFICDDLYMAAFSSEQIANLYAKGRHKLISGTIVTQNIFPKAKYFRDISLNSNYVILLKIRDLTSVETFLRQCVGKSDAKKALSAYNQAMRLNPFSHFLIDLNPNTPRSLQFRSNLFKETFPFEITYSI